MNESKKAIYEIIPSKYYPKTILITNKLPFQEVLSLLEFSQIAYPMIAKPDIGLRGSAVKKICNAEELDAYNFAADFDYLIQDLIPYENEVGIFYVRFPNESTGRITGIVSKEFLIIVGDGKSTMAELISCNPRFAIQLKVLQKEYGNMLETILPINEKKNLVPYGNHVRGAKFLDASNLNSEKLTSVIDNICIQLAGFYFGRLDIMYNSIEELEQGKNFSIVEVNGAASEPTHIYDPKHSIWFAWKELIRHVTYMYEISVENNRNGIDYLPHKIGMKEYRMHLANNKKILAFNK